MKDIQRQTRSHLMSLFKQFGFNPRGDLGQNFLIDVNLIELVVRSANLGPSDVVLEVGSGTGGMTAFLAAAAGHVVSVEIDRNMYALASHAVADCDNVTLMNLDVLRNKNNLAAEVIAVLREKLDAIPGSRLKLVANLPYSVATPVVSNLVASDLPWQRMVITIQLELGEKMAAPPGGKGYSALSVWLQSQSSVRILRRLGPKVFWPRPKVDSAIVSIWHDPKAAARIRDRAFLLDMVRRLFHQRRKLLRSVLTGMYRKQLTKAEVDALLDDAGLTPNTRAELMSVESLVDLANTIHTAIEAKSATAADEATTNHAADSQHDG
jgi:16S rRNA (adenine1518-N6/adenine1519-N6)-dimethyltransferase